MKAPLQRDLGSNVRFAGRPTGPLLFLVLLLSSSCGRPPEVQPVRAPERHSELREVVSRVATPDPPADVEPAEPKPHITSGGSEIGHGLDYQNDRVRSVPWSINLLKIDRSRPDLAFTTTLGHGQSLGLGPVTEQLASLPSDVGTPVAAINGDFYRTEQEPYAGDPRGLQIMRGELVSGPIGKTTFWIDPEGNPHLENVSSRFQVRWSDGTALPFGLNEERRSNDAVLYTPRAGASTHTSGGRELVLTRHGPEPWLPLRAGETYTLEVRQVRDSGNTRLNDDIMVLSIGPTLGPGAHSQGWGSGSTLDEHRPGIEGCANRVGRQPRPGPRREGSIQLHK